MKIVPTKNKFIPKSQPPIPYERSAKKVLSKNECLTFKLRNNPTDADSTTYEATIAYFSSGKPEEWLKFMRDLSKIFKGQNITNGPPKYAIMRRVLEGEALASFENAANNHGNETNDHFKDCVQEMTTSIFPLRALQKQKRALRRTMRKPREIKIRAHVARIKEICSLLKEFPPFGNDQGLSEDEIIELMEFAVPNSWTKQMTLQGFDPAEHTIDEFVQFCERIEETEDPVEGSGKIPKKQAGNSTPKKNNKRERDDRQEDQKLSDGRYYCMLHGYNSSHATNACKKLKHEAKRIKEKQEGFSDKKKEYHKKKELKEMTEVYEVFKQIKKRERQEDEQVEADMNNLEINDTVFSDESESDTN